MFFFGCVTVCPLIQSAEWIGLYFACWVLAIICASIGEAIPQIERWVGAGLPVFSLLGGMAAVGFVSIGLKANPGTLGFPFTFFLGVVAGLLVSYLLIFQIETAGVTTLPVEKARLLAG